MRYVAKIHVLDVLDQVVVSGYCIDTEHAGPDGEAPFEFAWQIPGIGADDPCTWLLDALKRALRQTSTPTRSR